MAEGLHQPPNEMHTAHDAIARTMSGRIIVVGLVLVTLGVSFCLFDGDELGMSRHAGFPDLCQGLAFFSFAVAILGLVAVGPIVPTRASPAYPISLRQLEPPPRFQFSS